MTLVGAASDSDGIVFMNGAEKTTEVDDFIGRCLKDIYSNPESMQAGLSSILLKQIAVSSSKL